MRLRKGDLGHGPVCPDCGGIKNPVARQCKTCRADAAKGDFTTGRRESTITFRNSKTGQVTTRVCPGKGRAEQVRYGLSMIASPESQDEWYVQCLSTPSSILVDLNRDRSSHRQGHTPGSQVKW
jgi:hypothetical protein